MTGRPIIHPCGTRAAYARGCRCEPCVEANKEYHRDQRRGVIPDRDPVYPKAPPPPGEWVNQAACRGRNVNDFFPGVGANVDHLRAICGACPVRADCLAWALDAFPTHNDQGFYGGCSAKERRSLRRDRYAS